MALYYDLPLYKDSYDFILKVFNITSKFDREYKYSLGQDMKKEAISLIRNIYRANKTYNKIEYLLIFVIFGLDPNIQKNQTVIVGLDPTIQKREINRLTGSSCQARGWQDKIEFNKFILSLIQKIIYNDPTKNSIFKWKKSDYLWLPKNKSLFFTKPNSGLPIWNLTSQLFSNIYLSDFDKYIKNELWCKYYWRYVDDFVIIHKDKEFLVSIISKISDYLQTNLCLTLHPNKIYMQHFKKGVLFLWAFIKPYKNYIRKRTIGNFYEKIQKLNSEVKMKYSCHYLAWLDNPENLNQLTRSPCQARGWQIFKNKFLSIINSYLWFLKHYKSYKVRKKLLLQNIHPSFWNHFYISWGYSKIVRKRK